MTNMPNEEFSYWRHNSRGEKTYPVLHEDLAVDTVIVGAGIAGLTAAYLLSKKGYKVAVLDKDTVGAGTTGHTTGKVTSQHNLIYTDLLERHGKEAAKKYAAVNQLAIEKTERIIQKEGIKCGWQRDDSFVFTARESRFEEFKREAKTAQELGLPASFETQTPLPMPVKAAVRFADQAKMNSQSYLNGLADAIIRNGGKIYKHSRVTAFHDGEPARIKANGHAVTANDILVTTKIPVLPLAARLTYAAFEYPHKSYIVAGKPETGISGMYISPDKDHYSILPVDYEDEQIVLVGGENHVPYTKRSEPRYKKLSEYADSKFGIKKIMYRWSAWDYIPYDRIPLVGKLYPQSEHMYVASAFQKWGLSTAMVAGLILRDRVMGKPNPYAQVFDSTRLKRSMYFPETAWREIRAFLH